MTLHGSSPYVLPLDSISDADSSSAGNKALRLARLRREGLPAPDGFVVPDEAFDHQGRVREPARGAVLAAFRALRDTAGAVAVRSSGAAEDAKNASFAGQFKTILGVAADEAFLPAVEEVYASLGGAQAYRERQSSRLNLNGSAPARGGGVLVQPLVRSTAAGVVFGCDPVTGDPETIVINAAWGLGEGVVSGEVMPELIRVSRSRLAVLARWPGNQQDERVYAPDAVGAFRLAQQPLSEERRRGPVLPDTLALRVARLALDCESVFGEPQDVEWALNGDDKLLFLQSRPVTATGVAGSGTWTSANSGEALPDPVSPLTWSLLTPLVERGRRGAFEALGVEEIPGEYMRLFLGRPYFNLDYFRAFLAQIPGLSTDLFDALIFTERVDTRSMNLLRPTLDRRYFKIIGLVASFAWQGRGLMDRFIPCLDRELEERSAADAEAWSEAELLREVAWLSGRIFEGFRLHVLGTAMAGASYLFLRQALSTWLPDEPDPAGALLTGVSGVASAEQGYALAELARIAADDPELAKLLCSRHDAGVLEELGALAAGPDFRARLDVFLRGYGHMGSGEADLLHPRWVEDPSGVLAAVAGYLHSGRIDLARRKPESLRARREREAARIDRLLGRGPAGFAKRALFRALWRASLRYAPYRENLRFSTLKAFVPLRRCFLELGRRLALGGPLAQPEDVFFLTASELSDAVEARLEGSVLAGRVAERQAKRRADLAVVPPPFFVGDRPGWVTPVQDGGMLTGLGASGGVSSGRVCVLSSPDQGHRLRQGDILVAPFADPAWTPLLLLAGGVVLEVGGVLSHAAVVAREYGVPCVVGVPMATRILQDGDHVTVDGTHGRVVKAGGS